MKLEIKVAEMLVQLVGYFSYVAELDSILSTPCGQPGVIFEQEQEVNP